VSADLIELLRLPRKRDAKSETEVLVSLRPDDRGTPVLEVRERTRSIGGAGWSYSKRAAGLYPDEWDRLIEAIVRAQEAAEDAGGHAPPK
jgi:hypothetical protein